MKSMICLNVSLSWREWTRDDDKRRDTRARLSSISCVCSTQVMSYLDSLRLWAQTFIDRKHIFDNPPFHKDSCWTWNYHQSSSRIGSSPAATRPPADRRPCPANCWLDKGQQLGLFFVVVLCRLTDGSPRYLHMNIFVKGCLFWVTYL